MTANQTGVLISELANSVTESVPAGRSSSLRLRGKLMAQKLIEQQGAETRGLRFHEILAKENTVSAQPKSKDNPGVKTQQNPAQNKPESRAANRGKDHTENNRGATGPGEKGTSARQVASSETPKTTPQQRGEDKAGPGDGQNLDTEQQGALADKQIPGDSEASPGDADESLQTLTAGVDEVETEILATTELSATDQPVPLLDEDGELATMITQDTTPGGMPLLDASEGEVTDEAAAGAGVIGSLASGPVDGAGPNTANTVAGQNRLAGTAARPGIAGQPATPFAVASLEAVMEQQMANEPEFALLETVREESLNRQRSGENPSPASMHAQLMAKALGSQAAAEASVSSAEKAVTEVAKFKEALSTLQPLGARPTAPAVSQYQLIDNRSALLQTGVQTALGQPQWSRAIGERVLWLAAQNVNAAEIQLDPPELGPLQVRVSVNQDQASVTFTSQHPAVREALDQSAMRLREMFDSQGLNLVDVDVSDQSLAQQSQAEAEEALIGGSGEAADGEDEGEPEVRSVSTVGLVDQYA